MKKEEFGPHGQEARLCRTILHSSFLMLHYFKLNRHNFFILSQPEDHRSSLDILIMDYSEVWLPHSFARLRAFRL